MQMVGEAAYKIGPSAKKLATHVIFAKAPEYTSVW
jgi:hypothetical protein